MSLQENFERLKGFDDDIRDYLTKSNENTLTDPTIDKIINFIHSNNYLQILYSYTEDLLSELMLHFLECENYEECVKIRDVVVNHNKATGERIKLKV